MNKRHFDAIIIGAGFAGIYQLYSLIKKLKLNCILLEKASDVGGTWFWNKYPGARCDSESYVYSYFFSKKIYKNWNWSERYSNQEQIQKYLKFVVNFYGLEKNIFLNTKVIKASFDQLNKKWQITTTNSNSFISKFLITATGCLSSKHKPYIKGLENFKGITLHTSEWPSSGIDLRGKKIIQIGTGSTGMQIAPEIARFAEKFYVLQRTANYSIPLRNKKLNYTELKNYQKNFDKIKNRVHSTDNGNYWQQKKISALNLAKEDCNTHFERAWLKGGLEFRSVFKDLQTDINTNNKARYFISNKIMEIVKDKKTAKILSNFDHPFGTKRPTLNSNYYEIFNKSNVSIIDLIKNPLVNISKKGIVTKFYEINCDIIIFATGFDAVTGPLLKLNLQGLNGIMLNDLWNNGYITYLGIQIPFFPNLFTITGPGSPSVLTNMPVQIEQHVEWITNCINYINKNKLSLFMPSQNDSYSWINTVKDSFQSSLHPKAKSSWYLGANITGKPKQFLPFAGGMKNYRKICNKIEKKSYENFIFE